MKKTLTRVLIALIALVVLSAGTYPKVYPKNDANALDVQYLALLIHADSTTATNDALLFESNKVTFAGSAAYSTTQKKFGAGAFYFPAADSGSNYATYPANAIHTVGTNLFGLSLWVYYASIPALGSGSWRPFLANGLGTSFMFALHEEDNKYYLYCGERTEITAPSLNTWIHYEVDRITSTTVRMFKDGTQIGSDITVASDWNPDFFRANELLAIGKYGTGGAALSMHGYIDEIVLQVGAPLHTSDFTSPTAPYTVGDYTVNMNGTEFRLTKKAN